MQNNFTTGIKIKKIRPLYNAIITTANKYEEDAKDNGLIIATKGSYKLYQTVVAIGHDVRNIQVGDLIQINPMRYLKGNAREAELTNAGDLAKKMAKDFKPETIVMDGIEYMCLYNSDASFVIEDYESVS